MMIYDDLWWFNMYGSLKQLDLEKTFKRTKDGGSTAKDEYFMDVLQVKNVERLVFAISGVLRLYTLKRKNHLKQPGVYPLTIINHWKWGGATSLAIVVLCCVQLHQTLQF